MSKIFTETRPIFSTIKMSSEVNLFPEILDYIMYFLLFDSMDKFHKSIQVR